MSERILLVEDDPLIADTIRLNIRGELPDADIVHVKTVQEARQAVEEERKFDFVYLDLWSNDGSGFKGLREFKKLFPGQSVLIAFRHLTLTA
ncbi:MAG: response regulator [Hyphomicrobiaceae bacterium]